MADEPKWTPGPWSVDVLMHSDPNGDDYPSEVEVGSDSGLHICGHDLGYNDDVDVAIIANAHLIAAAPDLYAALEAVRAVIPNAIKALMYSGRDGLLLADEIHKADDKARVALAKARGEA